VSSAVTQGVRVEVKSEFRPDRSTPSARRYLFTYTVKISNQGPALAQLAWRHWIITDANGEHEEVRGEGVVGQKPRIAPGESFEYSSFCVLKTAFGSMRGSYRMVRDDGTEFEAEIAPFTLAQPGALN
jgi:ApaG protein